MNKKFIKKNKNKIISRSGFLHSQSLENLLPSSSGVKSFRGKNFLRFISYNWLHAYRVNPETDLTTHGEPRDFAKFCQMTPILFLISTRWT